jgi:hypothetical protein
MIDWQTAGDILINPKKLIPRQRTRSAGRFVEETAPVFRQELPPDVWCIGTRSQKTKYQKRKENANEKN